jgi:5-methyltetrahydrofolate--homocysteine methyltransferase
MADYKNIHRYKPDWEETKQRFNAWWDRDSFDGRPMFSLRARRNEPLGALREIAETDDPEQLHADPVRQHLQMKNYFDSHIMMAESYPCANVNFGPGSLAVYLGSEPIFRKDTVWFSEVVEDWEEFGDLKFNPENRWFKRHLDIIREQVKLADGEYFISIPDIIENVDILASLRGTQNLCYDLIDQPELIKKYLDQLDELYFRYYDSFYEIIKDKDESSTYTVFGIWGKGRTAKVQCDFSALMSPTQFREFVQPSLRKQCDRLDHSLYHLDGPDAIVHLDAVMEIEGLDALQWTPGAALPDAGDERWDFIHDKVKAAGKSLWIAMGGKDYTEIVEKVDRLVKRYGTQGLYIILPEMSEDEGLRFMDKANKDWRLSV